MAERYGILTSYHDLGGALHHAAPDALIKVLQALGVEIEKPDESEALLKITPDFVEPASKVVWNGSLSRLTMHRAKAPARSMPQLTLTTESGDAVAPAVPLKPTAIPDSPDGWDLHLPEPMTLSPGYYKARIKWGKGESEFLLIVAPERHTRNFGGRRTGLFAPLYALHSAESHAIADLSALVPLIDLCDRSGLTVLATLPLLTLDDRLPYDPSPYRPLSRLFWNELYLDPRRTPEWSTAGKSSEAIAFASSPVATNNGQYLDYDRILELKRPVVQMLADRFFSSGGELSKDWADFLSRYPDAPAYARFRAERTKEQTSRSSAGGTTADLLDPLVRHHLYAQFRMDGQMREVSDQAGRRGITLMLDLPVGVHPDGFDTWRYPSLFLQGLSVGAPPDPLAASGQDWAFPPPSPYAMRADNYRYLRRYLAHHFAVGKMLRIDHVMGLHRLFTIPDGMPASQGVYLTYPANDLLAVHLLEASLCGAEIVGEDLGTVPDEVRHDMDRHGIRRLYVMPFEADPLSSSGYRPVPAEAVASLNTHDMPPFAAGKREVAKAILNGDEATSSGQGKDIVDLEDHLDFLAKSDAGLVLMNLEDLLGETELQNRPGTVDPRNWSRLCRSSLDDIIASEDISSLLNRIVKSRSLKESHMNSDQAAAVGSTGVRTTRQARTKSPATPASSRPEIGKSHPRFSLTDHDLYLFNEGTHYRLGEKLGSHLTSVDGLPGCRFAVWAPDADAVAVMGDFNYWSRDSHPLFPHGQSGIWEGFIPGIVQGMIYKYGIRSRHTGEQIEKADPCAIHHETPPKTGSVVWESNYTWKDSGWMKERGRRAQLAAPVAIYELHFGSWRRVPEESNRSLTFLEAASWLPEYLVALGFTHVEFLPLSEHPFYGSWGYQTTGYYAPSSRYGTPEDLMHLIDRLHQAGIGVILDWVPSHFPADGHGLYRFDGTHLYEHADARKGIHPDWDSAIFNYGRNEVRGFLISSALHWIDRFHIDGLRVDAVASMLYLDYSRKSGEWEPNPFGGRENLEAIDFLRRLNAEIYAEYPDVQTIAEESTSWPMVSRPNYVGGLGFGYKWDMGWMHDILDYATRDPIHRRFHHNALTFRMLYAFHENFILPLSHDEVVHGKGSLLAKMPGDLWQKFANLRLLLTALYTQPGKKLLFMGSEIAPWSEWNHETSLDWHLLQYPSHDGIWKLVADLNRIYRAEPALYEWDADPAGFEWIDCNDADSSSISFIRWAHEWRECIIVVLNWTPILRHDYRVGVPYSGQWSELLNSDSSYYYGSGQGNLGAVYTTGEPFHGRPDSLLLTLPPLGGVVLKWRK